mmetsp:Transcript_35070/g.76874  ORF Transcript_35070/g.76874 Transcript_35070/m.76874 type:complete len:355 (+) Transcript_35070:137-1201(+)
MCVFRCISGLITLATIAIIGVVVWRLLGRPESVDEAISAGSDLLGQAADVLQDFDWSEFDFSDMWGNEEHFSGGDNETLVWDLGANSRNGLILTLKNNLDDTWQEEYNTAVANWMDSNPAIVRLETEVVQDYLTDNKCNAEEGLMMVCNGNHGDNNMLGFNDLVFDQRGVIYSSVATMNEYYLSNAGWEERLYTMCHEMGHGLGLPHTDENPYNADTFNCMDYTDNPENNILPGDVNFSKLRDIYGEVSRRRLGRTSNLDRDRDRDRERASSRRNVPDGLHQSYKMAIADLKNEINDEYKASKGGGSASGGVASSDAASSSGWRKLHKNERGGTYVRDLVDGFRVQVSVLHPRK